MATEIFRNARAQPDRWRVAHTPHQILGPYFPATETPTATDDLTLLPGSNECAQGEIIQVKGSVRNRNGDALPGARLIVWQANSFGRYAHPNDTNPAPLDINFAGFAELLSDRNGQYQLKTVKPGAYPAGANRVRPPHIHFEVQGKFDRLITQMYFPGEPLNEADPLLLSANQPNLLVAQETPPLRASYRVFKFDIVLMRG
jgi:protocatechuate 3,4-dioxygenase, beta subunit